MRGASHERAVAVCRRGPAQPLQLVFTVRRVAQAVEPLQSPAAQHAGAPVAERLEAPAAVVGAPAAGPWMGGERNTLQQPPPSKTQHYIRSY